MAEEPLERQVTGQDLWEAIRTMPGRKASGLDSWTVDQLKALPRQAWDGMAAVMSRAEQRGKWPEELEGTKLVFLPEGQGRE